MSTSRFLPVIILAAVLLRTVIGSAFAGSSKKLTVLAIIYAKAGKEAQVKTELLKLVPPTRKEPACINYDMHVGVDPVTLGDNPGVFMFYENWRNRTEWDAHMKTPHLMHWLAIAPELTQRSDLTIWETVNTPTAQVLEGLPSRSSGQKFAVLSRMDVKPGSEARARNEIASLVSQTHSERGCVDYDMHMSLNMENSSQNPRQYMLYGNWHNHRAWKEAHQKAPYVVRWRAIAPSLTEKIDQTGWRRVDVE